jgi:CRISPR-associated protein Cmr2
MTASTRTYLALTVGPIYNTMQQARSTRALWSASYLFSYLMKMVIAHFKDTHSFIVPYVDNKELFSNPMKTGLFHDRFIFLQKDEHDFQLLHDAITEEVRRIAQNMASDLGISSEDDINTIIAYMNNYLRNSALKMDLKEDENPMEIIDEYLDTLELQPVFNKMESKNYIQQFIESKPENQQRNFLLKQAYTQEILAGKQDEIRFESIIEVTTAELSDPLFRRDKSLYWQIFRSEEKNVFKELLRINKDKELMRYHKYLAVLQVDGDYLGKVIKQLFRNDKLKVEKRFEHLSACLFEFDTEADSIIREFGAMPIYVGGDDIMCLAPLKCNGKHIFDLVDNLDNAFIRKVLNSEGLQEALTHVDKSPTLTYGISISYYKHPMNETLKEAHHQLRNVAKKKRNAVSFRLLKHSGSDFGATFNKSGELYRTYFKRMLEFSNESARKDDKTNSFLSSIQYTLMGNHGVLEAILHDDQAINEFFLHNFNESIHNNSLFIETVRDALKQAWKEIENEHIEIELMKKNTIETIHAMLRYIQFINQINGDE